MISKLLLLPLVLSLSTSVGIPSAENLSIFNGYNSGYVSSQSIETSSATCSFDFCSTDTIINSQNAGFDSQTSLIEGLAYLLNNGYLSFTYSGSLISSGWSADSVYGVLPVNYWVYLYGTGFYVTSSTLVSESNIGLGLTIGFDPVPSSYVSSNSNLKSFEKFSVYVSDFNILSSDSSDSYALSYLLPYNKPIYIYAAKSNKTNYVMQLAGWNTMTISGSNSYTYSDVYNTSFTFTTPPYNPAIKTSKTFIYFLKTYINPVFGDFNNFVVFWDNRSYYLFDLLYYASVSLFIVWLFVYVPYYFLKKLIKGGKKK